MSTISLRKTDQNPYDIRGQAKFDFTKQVYAVKYLISDQVTQIGQKYPKNI